MIDDSRQRARKALRARARQAEAYLSLGRIRRAVERQIEAGLIAQGLHDVTPAQANLLMALVQAQRPLTARALSEQLGVSEVSTSRLVHALRDAGWIERTRSPDDGRAWLLRPSERAREHIKDYAQVFNGVMDRAFAGFSLAERKQLGDYVDRVRANLED